MSRSRSSRLAWRDTIGEEDKPSGDADGPRDIAHTPYQTPFMFPKAADDDGPGPSRVQSTRPVGAGSLLSGTTYVGLAHVCFQENGIIAGPGAQRDITDNNYLLNQECTFGRVSKISATRPA